MSLERGVSRAQTTPMDARESVAVVVAHPDDETLWAGGTLLSMHNWSTFVASMCRRHDEVRAPKFYQVLSRLQALGAMGDLDDSPEQLPLADEHVESVLLGCLPSRRFERILTHSPLGEYTRHVRHEEVGRAVLRLWLSGTLSASELWLFAYDDQAGRTLPSALGSADISCQLPVEVWQQKRSLIIRDYGFSESSWEARVTPRTEAFFRVTTSAHALTWLDQRRST